MDLEQYGPWAVAFSLVLLTFKEIIMQSLKRDTKESGAGEMLELARAVDKLSAVLERIERSQDKALTEISANQREILRLLTELRTTQLERGSP